MKRARGGRPKLLSGPHIDLARCKAPGISRTWANTGRHSSTALSRHSKLPKEETPDPSNSSSGYKSVQDKTRANSTPLHRTARAEGRVRQLLCTHLAKYPNF